MVSFTLNSFFFSPPKGYQRHVVNKNTSFGTSLHTFVKTFDSNKYLPNDNDLIETKMIRAMNMVLGQKLIRREKKLNKFLFLLLKLSFLSKFVYQPMRNRLFY